MAEEWTEQDRARADVEHALTAAQKAHEPVTVPLVTPDDEDWGKFQSDDPEYFLRAASRVIRKYCGWSIFPNQKLTVHKIECGSRGIIMLPSRRVTQVDSLFISNDEHLPTHFVEPCDYVWHKSGYIERKGWAYWAGWEGLGGYGYYGNDQWYVPAWNTSYASCTFWSGYETLPEDVKTVAFELAEQAMTVRAGNIKMLESPGGYRAQTSQNFGLALNPEQMNRLANYRVGMVT